MWKYALNRDKGAIAKSMRRWRASGGRTYIQKKRSCGTIARKALRIAKGLAKQVEIKWKDTTAQPTLVSGTPSGAYLLNGMTQGDDPEGYRDGDKIKMLSVQGKGLFVSAVDENAFVVRMLIVYDRQPNGAAITWNDVISGTNVVNGLYTLSGARRGTFQVLYDRMIRVPAAGSATNGTEVGFKFYRRINREAHYHIGNAGDVTDMNKGSLIALFCSVGNGNNVVTDIRFRIQYTDL